MKTKQIIKKALCLIISAFLLTTSLPMQSFAQITVFVPKPTKAPREGYQWVFDYYSGDWVQEVDWKTMPGNRITSRPFRIFTGAEYKSGFTFWNTNKSGFLIVFSDGKKVLVPPGYPIPYGRNIIEAPGMEGWFVFEPIEEAEAGLSKFSNSDVARRAGLESISDETIKVSDLEKIDRKLLKEGPVFSQEELAKFINKGDAHGNLFGAINSRYNDSFVYGVPGGGETAYDFVGLGTKEGQMIAISPDGNFKVMSEEEFGKLYERIRGNDKVHIGWFKEKGPAYRNFLEIYQGDFTIITKSGERQFIKSNDIFDITDLSNIHRVERKVYDKYKPLHFVYRENLRGINRFIAQVERRIQLRHPNYKGIFFRRMFQNDSKHMVDEIEKNVSKKLAIRPKVSRAAIRAFSAACVVLALYLGFKYAPTVQAQNLNPQKPGEIISRLKTEIENVENASEKAEIIQNVMTFVDPDFESVIINDTIEEEGKLLAEMSVLMPSIKMMTGLSEGEAADMIAAEAVEPEYQLPYYEPPNIDIDTTNKVNL